MPLPTPQYEIRDDHGTLLTVPDFAYPDRKIAIFCDGYAYHGNVDALSQDARKRNALQAMGWSVLVFWGRQILRDPAGCEAQIWQCFEFRREVSATAVAANVQRHGVIRLPIEGRG